MQEMNFSDYVEYSEFDGLFRWKISPRYGVNIGDIAGRVSSGGYVNLTISGVTYAAHRIAFLMMGHEAPESVDHIDGNPTNNKWCNLRPSTLKQNGRNLKTRSDSKSGYRNVVWDKSRNKWIVSLYFNNRNKHIGRFDDLELAALVAHEAREKYFGEFSGNDRVGL